MTSEESNAEYDVAFQGARGAYSEAAAATLLGPQVRTLPSHALEDVFAAVTTRRSRYGVVPLENTIAGTVPRVYELLLSHDLHVVSETRIEIDHALIGSAGMALGDVRRVLSHPVALGQCRDFFRQHPEIEPVAVFDTAGAVEIVARERDGITAAIAGAHAAPIYGADVLAEHLQDHADNWTRFVLLARAGEAAAREPRRMLVAFDLPHVPAALVRALEPLAARAVNLTKIESRPIPTQPFEYRFIVEIASEDRSPLDAALADMRQRTSSLRVLGEYDTVQDAGSQS